MASSSRVACMTSRSSGRGLRIDLARASAPRSSTRRRRISSSTALRSWSTRPRYSSPSSRSSKADRSSASGRARLGLGDQALEHPVELEVPQRPVEVVGAPDRPALLDAGEAGHRLAGHQPHERLVALEQGLVEHRGQLLGGHLVRRSPAALLALRIAAERLASASSPDGAPPPPSSPEPSPRAK